MDPRHQAYEQRAAEIEQLWARGAAACVTIGLNLPGGAAAYQLSSDLAAAAREAVQMALADAGHQLTIASEGIDGAGPYLLATVSPTGDPGQLKRLLIEVEQQHPLGRLFDLDVLISGKGPLSREDLGLPARRCLICTEAARVCRRVSRHRLPELQTAVKQLTDRYDPATFAQLGGEGLPVNLLAAAIGAQVTAGMLLEVSCWPSPGLVSPVDSGGHTDMALPTFLTSSSVIAPGFSLLASLGIAGSDRPPGELLPQLRAAGYLFEQRMLSATGGVNTHRGYLFLGGLLAAAAGYLAARKDLSCLQAGDLTAAELGKLVAACAGGLVQRELQSGAGSARALQLYGTAGLTGPRGEAEAGLPTVQRVGLPALLHALSEGASLNDALVHTLIALIATVGDTALAGRHQVSTLPSVVWPAAQAALTAGSIFSLAGQVAIRQLARDFAERRLNPGGSADLLALTAATYLLEHGRWPAGAELAPSRFRLDAHSPALL